MKKIIYSLYIDIDKSELDWQKPYDWDSDAMPKTERTKLLFQEHYNWLKQRQLEYAEAINVEYRLYENDKAWYDYKEMFAKKYPQITAYNVVNFYKIHLLNELAKEYDEVLYLDFDVVPLNNDNFFESHDLQNNGIAILKNNSHIHFDYHKITKDAYKRMKYDRKISNRSPTAKYWNARAMLIESDQSGENDVFNTGIIGASAKDIKELNYFDNFDKTLKLMDSLVNDDTEMWPIHLIETFGWDNETIWSYKVKMNDIKIQWLNEKWHHFLDKWDYIPANTTLCHVINKKFDFVKNWYEKNSL